MSIVGPRPLPVVETRGLTGSHRRRLSMRPGITGLWQVSGRSELSFDEMVLLDVYYIETWSLGLDVRILLKTLPAVLSAGGAF
jgi:lipopolysaccharide/colanic/teichoic acid biosynthesis glycosyltransferase